MQASFVKLGRTPKLMLYAQMSTKPLSVPPLLSHLNDDYTVGYICALSIEYLAAQLCLDEEHERPEYVSCHDNNDYTLGKIGKHNVVIAVLPDGEYGTSSAAGVARDMLHSFPNVRIGLMVGIGGGAPSTRHDVRLGDIVVSTPRDGKGGVLQYDFGKTIQDQSFRQTAFLNRPPTVLLTAVSGLKVQYQRKRHQLEEAINVILEENEDLREELGRPDASSDRLYKPDVVHPPDKKSSCVKVCGVDPSKSVEQLKRTKQPQSPIIHYGLIASANQLMKDARVRDKLAAEHDVLCFEMEAAGLMNHFPCLVVRGICDYSDSHKNEEWQGYAATAAAAYAKDLLCRISPYKIEAERKIGDILSGIQDDTKKIIQVYEGLAKQKLSEEEQKCHQAFRLTSGNSDTTYEWYKDRVEERVEGTCMWFLNHKHFHEWLNQESGPLLVSADPGCGKSVLAKYLIDHALPRSTTICYFFFKDQDQNTVCQALCALLHQLFSQKPSLIEYALPQFRKDGPGMANSTKSLWEILRNATKDPRAGPMIIVLDALDECTKSEFENLVQNVEGQFRCDQSGQGRLKYLLTCRPYKQIVSEFRDLLRAFPNIHIPGEEHSEAISQEVDQVISHRINKLSDNIPMEIKSHLERKLQEITHRTYLWLYLVFDHLKEEDFIMTTTGAESAIATLPASINEAYEQILNKSKKHPMVRKALCIILAARRPLTLSEMKVAVNIEPHSKSLYKLNSESEENFKSRLRSWCGLFISIYHGKIYLLHQTAREFLLADSAYLTTVTPGLHWHRSIAAQDAQAVLAELCVLYLDFFNFDAGLRKNADENVCHLGASVAFFDYSAQHWGDHFREAGIVDGAAILPFALRICDPNSRCYSTWLGIYWMSKFMSPTEDFTDLMVASYFGHEAVVRLLLERDTAVDTKERYGRTPLWWAATNGHEAVVRLLLDRGAAVDTGDKEHKTPLACAADEGHKAVVQLLLDRGAAIDLRDKKNRTPLACAAKKGHEAVVQLLLDRDAVVDAKDNYDKTPLACAADEGHEAIVRLLLDRGAAVDGQGDKVWTPLEWAAFNRHAAIARLLLDRGAVIDTPCREIHSPKPLWWAAYSGHESVVQLLLDRGAAGDLNTGHNGETPLLMAAAKGYEAVVRLLLDRGATVDAKDNDGVTPLASAVRCGHKAIVRLLLDSGAAIDGKDNGGWTPLASAALNGDEAVVRLLLDRGAAVDTKNNINGSMPPWLAVTTRYEVIVRLLLDRGAVVDAKDRYGETPLLHAASNGQEAIVQLLTDRGADVDAEGRYVVTPLWSAVMKGHEAIVRKLLDRGASTDGGKYAGTTPLTFAAKNGNEALVRLLLDRGASIDGGKYPGMTPLARAADEGHEAIVRLLLDSGAFTDAGDNHHGPLLCAARHGHEAIVRLLLDRGAAVDAKDYNGLTPLARAARGGHEAVVRLLLDRGTTIDAGGRSLTPLAHAIHRGHEAVVRLLLDRGATIAPGAKA